ncbi:MAG: hypothetical protein A2Y62_18225 [Candidatus Fischerbacteria bacterium RBG_13_37_8]|uniref:Major facilitator superfamily (MFS) profile domain-containing protein n=1 Tax=Candidatus Fischerbacteria bacterium RBG_13_37_8 TaxID=1817863 RepID=A0A1F5VVJ5_9BACT|nr:MAG: hypothetical protein A2Y62_18225 [Candidatus Fischerbacteria bacterium RBG_13_37_8]
MSVSLFFVFPLFFEQYNASKSRIGLIMGINSLIIIFVRPIFGRLIDIKGRKNISLLGIFIMVLAYPFFHFIHDAGWLPILLRGLVGVGWGIGMTAIMTMCSDLAPTEKLAHSIGIIGISGLLSQAIGPALAEEIINRFGFAGLFNAAIIFAVFSFFCIYYIPEAKLPHMSQSSKKGSFMRQTSIPVFIIICALPLIHGAERGSIIYFITLFAKSINLGRVAPFFIAFSIAAIITRLGIGDLSDRYGRKKVILPGAIIICLNLFIISHLNNSLMLYVTGFLGGFGQGLLFPALSSYIIDIFGTENKGFAISLYLTLLDTGIGLGTPLFGKIADMYNYRIMYVISSLMLLAMTTIFMLKAPESGNRD